MEDQQIVTLYHQRDERAIEESSRKYGPLCQTIAMNLLSVREDAEECVNDTWQAAWTRMPPDKPHSLGAFLGRITRNLSISRFRSNRAQKRYSSMEVMLSELDDCVPSSQNVEQIVDRHRLAELISGWLDSLRSEDRVLFVRRYWYGDEVQALAVRLGCPPNRLAQRMLRLRRSLKAFLEQEGVSV